MRSRLAGLIAATAMLMCIADMPVHAQLRGMSQDGRYSYEILEDGTISVRCEDRTITDAQIPSEIDGYTVTALEEAAFGAGFTELRSVTFPESIVSLGDNCFRGCTALEEITLPEKLTSIGYRAFFQCSSLEQLHLPASVTELSDFALDGMTSVTAITVAPENPVYTAADGVLYDKNLTTLILYPEAKTDTAYTPEKTCTRIADWAFVGASCLEEADLRNVTEIGADAFFGCTALERVVLSDAVEVLPENVFSGCLQLTEIKLPASLREIGYSCFGTCIALESVELPEGLETIGEYAFVDCNALGSVYIPDSVETIEGKALGFSYMTESGGMQKLDGFTLELSADSYFDENCAAKQYAAEHGIPCTLRGAGWMLGIAAVAAAVIAAWLLLYALRRRKKKLPGKDE